MQCSSASTHFMRGLLLALCLSGPCAMAADISSLWNYSDPEESERRFRAALAEAAGDDALILQTQIARTHGLRRNFPEARRVLAEIQEPVSRAAPEAQVRYCLELGRTYASVAHKPEEVTPEDREKARSLFMNAFETARGARLDYLAIDALHMMSSVDVGPKDQLAWDLKALAFMEASPQAEAKKWEGSLRNNVGYANFLLGNYDEALAEYRLSLAAHERSGRAANVRIAYWMIARTLRAQGLIQEAIAIQLRLEREWNDAGESDPYVYEELEQLYRQSGDIALAEQYAAKLQASRQSP
jgi:tetratricopeptide (TPR) repeat protein